MLLALVSATAAWLHFRDPDAVQEVNATADWIIQAKTVGELERFADDLMHEFPPRPPKSQQPDQSVPPERLPMRFWRLGGDTVEAPTAIYVTPTPSVHLYWARFASAGHDVLIFDKPPSDPPQGFFGRRISPRVFIVSRSGNRAYDKTPAGDARHLSQ